MTTLLAAIRSDLHVSHEDDDAMLQRALDASLVEARQFLGLEELPMQAADPVSDESEGTLELAPDVYAAVVLLVRAKYDTFAATEIERLRDAAETLLHPYRKGLGV